ncbi:MAG: nucleotidyltransferase domain-containing protein [Calditrichaeota bacterium]|nr:nucleotidyltransferase domain-containing protein [Calditrichota bacterium]MCB9369334.1 nucleotidyltransferase domain-containing protein [Calditrichota bacterium]
MTTAKLKKILDELRGALSEHYGERLSKLVLFGSQARGDAEEDSDIDVLVVLNSPVRPLKEIAETGDFVARISAENGVVINTLFVSQKEYDARQEPVIINAAREGRAL